MRVPTGSKLITCCLHFALLFLILLSFSGIAQANNTDALSTPCSVGEAYLPGLNGDASSNIHSDQQYMNTVSQMLHDEAYAEIDCLADRARQNRERFPGGVWKLHILYSGLEQAAAAPQHATQEDWQLQLARLQTYVDARPKSVTARVALAQTYLNFAWNARGSGYSDSVSGSGWRLFEERTAKARQILSEASSQSAKCPEWYLTMQGVAQNQSWDASDARALFEEAYKLEPQYYYYSRMLANYLLPKWSGEAGETEQFAEDIANRIGGDEGDYVYFQIANYLICGCGDDLHFSWTRVVRGFKASEKLYGASMLNLNLIAYLAVHMSKPDPVVADNAMVRIGDEWDEGKWGNREQFESMRQWAAAAAPISAKHQNLQDEAQANLQTAEGLAYKASFEKKYRSLVKECVKAEGANGDKFETLTSVGAEGTVEDMRIFWNGPSAICLYNKLSTFKHKKTRVFPKPPRSPYWIRLDLDAGEFTVAVSH